MDEWMRFRSSISETSEPFQWTQWTAWKSENGRKHTKATGQCGFDADWLGKSTRVDRLQSTRDRPMEQTMKSTSKWWTRMELGWQRRQSAQRPIFDSTPTPVDHQCSQCWTMPEVTMMTIAMTMSLSWWQWFFSKLWIVKKTTRTICFPTTTIIFPLLYLLSLPSTIYLVEIVMVRKKKNGGNVASKYSGWSTVTRNGRNAHSPVLHSIQFTRLGS